MGAFSTGAFAPIPSLIAPARPVLNQISGSYNGQPVSIDQFGGMTDASGKSVGVLPSSGAATPATTAAPSTVSNIITAATNYFGITKVGAGIVPSTNSSWLSRGVFIALGLLLIAAGIFSFKSSQAVVQEFVGGVREGAKSAAAVAV